MTAEEFLRDINLIQLNDQLSWVEKNKRILELIKNRDQGLESSYQARSKSFSSKSSGLNEIVLCLN